MPSVLRDHPSVDAGRRNCGAPKKIPRRRRRGLNDGGGGGNRTRVRKPYIPGPTCLAVSLFLVERYPSGREDVQPAQVHFSEPALSTLDPRACERVPRVWMHKHMPVEG